MSVHLPFASTWVDTGKRVLFSVLHTCHKRTFLSLSCCSPSLSHRNPLNLYLHHAVLRKVHQDVLPSHCVVVDAAVVVVDLHDGAAVLASMVVDVLYDAR